MPVLDVVTKKRKARYGRCRICERFTKMTREHVPPESAFNDSEYLKVEVDLKRTDREIVRKIVPGNGRGRYVYTLCEKCNSVTGNLYGSHYLAFVRAFADVATPENANTTVTVTVKNFYPGRLLKQVISLVLSTSFPACDLGSDLTSTWNPYVDDDPKEPAIVQPPDNERLRAIYSELRDFVKDKNRTGLPAGVRLYAHAGTNKGVGFEGGIMLVGNRDTGGHFWFVPVGFWPVHFTLVLDGTPFQDLLEITDFAQIGFKEYRTERVVMPVYWTAGRLPLDFRDPYTIQRSVFVSWMVQNGFRPVAGLSLDERYRYARQFAHMKAKWIGQYLIADLGDGCYFEDGSHYWCFEGLEPHELRKLLDTGMRDHLLKLAVAEGTE